MPRIEVEPGVEVYAQDVGAGPPVVLIAGFGLSHGAWDPTVRSLTAAHRVVCVDLRGTGLSDKPAGDYGIDRLVQDVVLVLEALDLRELTLVGWSFGGQISLALAAAHPERLARVVLVGSNGVRASRSEEFPFGPPPDALEGALVRAEIETRLATRRRAIASGFRAEPEPALIDWLLSIQLQMPSWAAIACYRTYLHTDLLAALPAVTLPLLQIMGSEDPVTPVEGAPWVQERLSDGRLVVLEDCGHYPMYELRERFEAELLAFVDEP